MSDQKTVELAEKILNNLIAFEREQPVGPCEMDMILDPLRKFLARRDEGVQALILRRIEIGKGLLTAPSGSADRAWQAGCNMGLSSAARVVREVLT